MAQTKEPKEQKPRVYALANELNLDTKAVLDICKELGYTAITSQLKTLEPDQVEAIKARAKKGPSTSGGGHATHTPAPMPAKPATPPKLETKVPTLTKPKPTPAAKPISPSPVAEAPPPAIHREPEPEVVAAVAPPAAEPEPEPVAPEPTPIVAEAPVTEPTVNAVPAPAPMPTGFNTTAGRMPNLSGRPQNLGNRPPQTRPPMPARPTAPPATTPAPAAPQPPAAVTPPVAAPSVPSAVAPTPTPAAAPTPVAHRPATPAPAQPHQPPMAPRPTSASGTTGHAPPRTGHTPPAPAPRGSGSMPNLSGGGGPRPPMGGGGSSSGGPSAGPPPQRSGPSGPPQRAGGMPPRQGAGGPMGGGPRPGGPGPGAPGQKPMAASGPPGSAKSVKLTPEQIQRMRELERKRGEKVGIGDVHRDLAPPVAPDPNKPAAPNDGRGGPARGPVTPGRPAPGGRPDEGDSGDGRKKVGEVAGRSDRHKQRQNQGRGRGTGTDKGSVIIGAGGSVDMIESQYGSRIKKHRGRAHVKPVTKVIGGRTEITLPITVRSLSETIGMKTGELLLKLKNLTNSLYTINSNVEFDVAEMIGIEKGVELVAKKTETAEEKMMRELDEAANKSDAENLRTRSPIVTIMGHVDHGKTSLLDKIRQTYGHTSDVVSTEAGGITQVLRAWRVEKDGKSTTFLDTPGHEAFTKMRARGANVTDIAVIVVSAADGIMPQTEEAVAHAKAANVEIIVAINKVDLPGANPDKIKNQLYSLELVPEEMGGDVPVVLTSAVTGQGIGDLLDSIGILAELADPPLQADATLAGSGTCLEAYMEGDRGVVATLLVQNGTLRKGDILLCGSTFGRVRAMYDDLGRPTEEAGPSTPVKIIGLSEVPDADDPFYVLDDLTRAREIADKRKDAKQEAALSKFSPVSLDKLKEQNAKAKISELKVILKAEARGSVEAIKKELEKLTHEEVRTRVLHSGIGAITESDVTLALTSPEDTLIVGFNVTADDAALALAEARGINIREYQIIYNLVDDVKAALEGRLKPIEEVVHLGRAIVRQTFKVGKVGTIAGCYVTSGVIERNSKVRIIREGVVIYPPPEKTLGLESLKRFKDDAKEVREGFECGMKITGFDDVKVGDVIEAFRIDIKQRTL